MVPRHTKRRAAAQLRRRSWDAATTGASGIRWMAEAGSQLLALDQAVVDAVANTPTPGIDRFLVHLSRAADYSRLWLLTAAVAAAGGGRARRAAGPGVVAIGLASAVTNAGVKPLSRRRRPSPSDDRERSGSRRVRRPTSASFPSGHAASAFAFASAMGDAMPVTWIPLHAAAAAVGYSRVHTGMHYPSDVAVGAMIGALCGSTVRRVADQIPTGLAYRRQTP